MEGDEQVGRGVGHFVAVELHHCLAGREGQIEDRQGEHHLGEITRGIGQVFGQERRLAVVLRVIEPEVADRHQTGKLLSDGQVVIIVLGPFLRGIDLAIELRRPFGFLAIVLAVELGLVLLLSFLYAIELLRKLLEFAAAVSRL